MRLLIVNPEYPPVGGGAGNASRFLAEVLTQQGHRVSVVTAAYGQYRDLRIEDGVRVHRIPSFRRRIDRAGVGQMGCFATTGLLLAAKIARAEKVEGSIAFFTLPSGLISYSLKVRLGLPYVVSLRGGDVPGLVPELNWTHRRIRWLRRQVLRSAQAIVANAPGLAQLSLQADPFEVGIIPNGVDGELFCPSPGRSASAERPFRVLFAGRLRPQKNLELLLDQLAHLHRQGVPEFVLDVAGDGPLGSELRQRAQRLGLKDRVRWHGWTSKADLIELYQDADCFVNPSLYEGLPNTVLEAMACGLPVVASRVPGNDELVTDRETGRLFALEDPQQLSSALANLLNDRAAAVRMGDRARQRVLGTFSWQTAASAYLRLFDPLYEPVGNRAAE